MQPQSKTQCAAAAGVGDPNDAPVGQGEQNVVVPLAREEVHVGKEMVETGRVVVRVTPVTRTEQVDVSGAEERAVVERVAVNRVVNEIQPPRQEGDIMIVPIYEEQVVVERRLVLKEEVRIRVERSTRRESREVELRSERVEVTKQNPG